MMRISIQIFCQFIVEDKLLLQLKLRMSMFVLASAPDNFTHALFVINKRILNLPIFVHACKGLMVILRTNNIIKDAKMYFILKRWQRFKEMT